MQHGSIASGQSGSTLYTVIQSLIDSQEALVEVGERLEDKDLKRFFLAESLKRAEFRVELESALNQEGVADLCEGEAAPGPVQSALTHLRLRSHEACFDALMATAELGEEAARQAYAHAINTILPPSIEKLLTSQASHISESHNFLKAARQRAA
jgi:uncharacterized protein (TIGR02284 family)